jgi:fructose-bisphosphate aldolase class 1
MTANDLNETARALVAEGKGILAADESVPLKRRAGKGHKAR